MTTKNASVPAAKPKAIDWEAIERDYRAGILSLREIAKTQGISDTAIRKHAKANGWERDLTDRVNEKVRTQLVRAEVRTANPQTEREIVEVAAEAVVSVVLRGRKRITAQTELVDLLTKQLMDVAGTREDFEEAIDELTADDRTGERRARLMKAIALPTHASTAVNLSNALKTLIGLERQAFNIRDEAQAPADALATLLSRVNGTALPVAAAEPEDD